MPSGSGPTGGSASRVLGKIVPVYRETDGKSVVDGKSRVEKSVVTPTLEDTHWGVWVMGSGIFGRNYSVENLPNYRYSSGQFLVGADHRWNKYFSTGLFAGYQGAYATYPESERVWMNGATFGVYATFDARNGFYASTIVSGSYSNYSTRRSIEFGTIDRTARGDLDSGSVGTFLKLGYDFKAGGFTFGPVVSGQYTYLGVAPFTESGADSLNLRVGQQNLNSLQLNVGGRLAYTWSLADGNILLIPQVRMFWNHEFLQNSTSISSSLDGGAGPGFNYRTISPSRDSVFAGAGLVAQLGRNWNASVYYNTDFGSATSNTHIVSASAGFLW
jgi:fibronectin-binding autotransporter adhesin